MAKGIDTSALVAAALARGVQVTHLPAGERAIDEYTFRRYRGDDLDRVLRAKADHDPINERHVVVDHRGVEHVRNGLGEWLS